MLYDVTGRVVRILVDGERPKGRYHNRVSGLASGVYFLKMETKDFAEVRKIVILNPEDR